MWGIRTLFEITTLVGGVSASYIVYVNLDNNNQVNQMVKIYADPGTTVQAFSANASPAKSTGGFMSISGHLINYP